MSKEENGHHEEKKHGHGHGEGMHEDEYYSIKKGNLWLVAGGALGALAALGIGKVSKKIRPSVVGAVKEGYAFKEWVAGKYERAKEDVEDIVEEAKHAYHKDLEATVAAVKKEKEILKMVEEAVERKTTKRKAKKED
jgi:hypothetical protein